LLCGMDQSAPGYYKCLIERFRLQQSTNSSRDQDLPKVETLSDDDSERSPELLAFIMNVLSSESLSDISFVEKIKDIIRDILSNCVDDYMRPAVVNVLKNVVADRALQDETKIALLEILQDPQIRDCIFMFIQSAANEHIDILQQELKKAVNRNKRYLEENISNASRMAGASFSVEVRQHALTFLRDKEAVDAAVYFITECIKQLWQKTLQLPGYSVQTVYRIGKHVVCDGLGRVGIREGGTKED